MEPLLFPLLLVVAGVGAFYGGRHMAKTALQPVVRFEQPVQRGTRLKVTVFTRPRQDVKVDQVEVTLSCIRTEDARQDEWHFLKWGRTHYDHWERDTAAKDHVIYPVDRVYRKGSSEEATYEVEVSRDGFPTDTQGVLTIRWNLRIRFAIPGFPDCVLDRPVRVTR